MKLRFGLHLDGQHGRYATNQLGVSDVGPLGLLTIMETQLGLVSPQESASERIVQYRDCLLKLGSQERFFHASLARDDFGVAAELLEWRDTWRLHGWNGTIPSDNTSVRLNDMAEVEALAITQVAPGLAQRLNAVLQALTSAGFPIRSRAGWKNCIPCRPPGYSGMRSSSDCRCRRNMNCPSPRKSRAARYRNARKSCGGQTNTGSRAAGSICAQAAHCTGCSAPIRCPASCRY